MAAWEAGVDLIGLVFAPSRRKITLEQGARIVTIVKDRIPMPDQKYPFQMIGLEPARPMTRPWETMPSTPAFVGVFVNQSYDEIMRTVESCRLDYVQLHGDETPEFCRQLGVPVIKAVRPVEPQDAAECKEYVSAGALLLFDTYAADSYGGTGVLGNWALAAELAQLYPLILAGGLDPENVAAAIRIVQPWGVDVSSGVETFGSKDLEKIRSFLQAVHSTAGPAHDRLP
ncbi:MAG: phosphoribosylanthranilate isomerase [Chloroflexota bacterium]|nr:MAG: phosphoribosylanthranilate isomerase [Chloroflexota bacterium]